MVETSLLLYVAAESTRLGSALMSTDSATLVSGTVEEGSGGCKSHCM